MRKEELRGAIDGLYKVFERYPRPREFDFAQGLVPEAKLALRDVHENWCCWYLPKAVTSLGTVTDFKHFLPRVFEVGIYHWTTGCWPGTKCNPQLKIILPVELPLLARRLVYAGFNQWPEKEKEAVQVVVRAAWRMRIVWPDDGLGKPMRSNAFLDELWMPFYCLVPDFSWVVSDWAAAVRTPVLREPAMMYLARVLVEDRDDCLAYAEAREATSRQKAMMARLLGNKILQRFLITRAQSENEEEWMKSRLIEAWDRARGYQAVWMAHRREMRK